MHPRNQKFYLYQNIKRYQVWCIMYIYIWLIAHICHIQSMSLSKWCWCCTLKALEFAAKIPKPKQKEAFNKNDPNEKKPQNHEQTIHTLSKIQLLEAKHHIDQEFVQVSYSFKPHFYLNFVISKNIYPRHLVTKCTDYFWLNFICGKIFHCILWIP